MPGIQKNKVPVVAQAHASARGHWRGDLAAFAHGKPNAQIRQVPSRSLETLHDLTNLYRASSYYRDLGEKTKESYELYLGRISAEFGDWPISAFEERGARTAIRQWRDDDLAHQPRTADFTIGVLRRLLNFAVDEEYIDRNPVTLLGRIHKTTRRDSIWSDRQIVAFLAKAPRHLARVLLMAVWTGQRKADLLRLTWDSYDGTHIRLQQRKARGSRGRRVKVFVSAELRKVLAEIRREQIARSEHADPKKRVPRPSVILTTGMGLPWQGGFNCAWRTAVRNARIKGLTFHDLRGTFVTLAHRAGATMKEIAEATGHDEFECERVIRHHYLASGAELVISRLEAVAGFTSEKWDEGDLTREIDQSDTGAGLDVQIGSEAKPGDRFTGPRRSRAPSRSVA